MANLYDGIANFMGLAVKFKVSQAPTDVPPESQSIEELTKTLFEQLEAGGTSNVLVTTELILKRLSPPREVA